MTTFLKLGENHLQRQAISLIRPVYASAVKSKVEICELASPCPAIHEQCAQRMVPHFSAPMQGLRAAFDTACECQTQAVGTALVLSTVTLCIDTSLTQPDTRYLYPSKPL